MPLHKVADFPFLCSIHLPIAVLYITVERHVTHPTVFAEQVADVLLQGRWDKARTVAILKVVGAVG
jgi:hypothetical protein